MVDPSTGTPSPDILETDVAKQRNEASKGTAMAAGLWRHEPATPTRSSNIYSVLNAVKLPSLSLEEMVAATARSSDRPPRFSRNSDHRRGAHNIQLFLRDYAS